MKRIKGLTFQDKDKLYDLLKSDNNFEYIISEGAFCTNDNVFIGIDRSPYHCCLYALSEKDEKNIDKWEAYILEKWNLSHLN